MQVSVPLYSSHGNSKKKHENQVLVAEDVARQLSSPETADNIMGVMVRLNCSYDE